MSAVITFKCQHCSQEIEVEDEYGGQEASCPSCSKTIIIPKAEVKAEVQPEADQLLGKYPNLKNRSEKDLENALNFLNAYTKVYCEVHPTKDDSMHILSIAFTNGVGPAIVKRYENAIFSTKMSGSTSSNTKLNDVLFSNKKLNKQLNAVITSAGVKVKKSGFLGLFG